MTYQECLNFIYSSFMQIKPHIKGKADCYVRKPAIIMNLVAELGVMPDANKTIKITGSKGKGTTTRLIEKSIRATVPSANIAILTSPEEIEHTDRMKINGNEISKRKFASIINDIKPTLDKLQQNFVGLEYLSPSGLFILIAFIWFAKQNIDYFVLETGRGAQFDEIGIMKTKVSVISSIFLEHPTYLGKTIESIAKHKLYACQTASLSVLDKTALSFYDSNKYKTIIVKPQCDIRIPNYPDWYSNNASLAIAGVSSLLNIPQLKIKDAFISSNDMVVASFGMKQINNTVYYYDPAISSQSIDHKLLSELSDKKIIFVISMPDDKDYDGVINELKLFGSVNHIVLTGTRGYLDYNHTICNYSNDILWTGDYSDKEGFKKALSNINADVIYCLGTQTYIRLVKQALFGF